MRILRFALISIHRKAHTPMTQATAKPALLPRGIPYRGEFQLGHRYYRSNS